MAASEWLYVMVKLRKPNDINIAIAAHFLKRALDAVGAIPPHILAGIGALAAISLGSSNGIKPVAIELKFRAHDLESIDTSSPWKRRKAIKPATASDHS